MPIWSTLTSVCNHTYFCTGVIWWSMCVRRVHCAWVQRVHVPPRPAPAGWPAPLCQLAPPGPSAPAPPLPVRTLQAPSKGTRTFVVDQQGQPGGGATKWAVMWGAGSSGPASEARHAGADQAVFLAAAVQRVRSVCVLSFCSCYWPKRSWGEEQSCLLVNITIYTWIYGCSNTGGLNVLDISQKDRETHDKKFFHNRNQELIGYILQYFVTIDET